MGLSPFMFMVKGAVDEGTRLMNEVRAGRAEIAKDERAQANQLAQLGFTRQTKLLQVDAESKMRSKILGEKLAGEAKEGVKNRANALAVQELQNAATLGKNRQTIRSNFSVIGDLDGIHVLRPTKGGDQMTRNTSFFTNLAKLNPADYAYLKNTTSLVSEMGTAYNTLANQLTNRDLNGRIVGREDPLTTLFPGVFRKNSELKADVEKLSGTIMRNGIRSDNGNNVDYVYKKNGVPTAAAKSSLSNAPIIQKALVNFNNTLIGAEKQLDLNTPAGRQMLKARISEEYGIEPTEGNGLKIYQALGNDLVAHVLKGGAIQSKIDGAAKFFAETKNTWVNQDGRITNDFKLLVAMAANKKDVKQDGPYTRRDKIPYRVLNETDLQKVAAYKSYTDAAPLARAGLETIDKLINNIKTTGTPSSLVNEARRVISVLPDLADQAERALRSVRPRKVNGVDIGGTSSSVAEKLINNIATFRNLANKETLSTNDASALTSSLRYILAYQLSSVLQGGTGGKTISDTDVKINLDIIGNDVFTNVNRSLAKLGIIRGMLVNTVNMADLYNLPLSGKGQWKNNKDVLGAIQSAGQLLKMDALAGNSGEERARNLLTRANEAVRGMTLNGSSFRIGPDENLPEELFKAVADVDTEKYPEYSTFNKATFTEWLGKDTTTRYRFSRVSQRQDTSIKNFRIWIPQGGSNPHIVDDDSYERLLMVAASNQSPEKKAEVLQKLSKSAYNMVTNRGETITYSLTKQGVVNVKISGEDPSVKTGTQIAEERDETFQVKVDGYLGGLTKKDGLNQRQFSTAAVRELKGLGVNFSPEGFIALMQNFSKELGSDMMGEVFNGITTKQLGGGKTETNAGIAQWRGDRLKAFEEFARGREDGDIRSLKTNLEFLIYEMQNGEAGGTNREDYRKLFRELTENPNRRSAEELGALINGVYLRSQRPNKLDYKGGRVGRAIPGRKPFFNSQNIKKNRKGT